MGTVIFWLVVIGAGVTIIYCRFFQDAEKRNALKERWKEMSTEERWKVLMPAVVAGIVLLTLHFMYIVAFGIGSWFTWWTSTHIAWVVHIGIAGVIVLGCLESAGLLSNKVADWSQIWIIWSVIGFCILLGIASTISLVSSGIQTASAAIQEGTEKHEEHQEDERGADRHPFAGQWWADDTQAIRIQPGETRTLVHDRFVYATPWASGPYKFKTDRDGEFITRYPGDRNFNIPGNRRTWYIKAPKDGGTITVVPVYSKRRDVLTSRRFTDHLAEIDLAEVLRH